MIETDKQWGMRNARGVMWAAVFSIPLWLIIGGVIAYCATR